MTDTKKIVEFWKMLESNQFVKSTNSITNQVEEYPPAIQDMEAIVKINGEFDKYAIEEWLATKIAQAIAEERARIFGEVNRFTVYYRSIFSQNCDRNETEEEKNTEMIDLADLLSSLEKPVTKKE